MENKPQIREIAINDRMKRVGIEKVELWDLEDHGSYYTALLYEELKHKGEFVNTLKPVTLFKKRNGDKVFEKQYDFVCKIAGRIGAVIEMPHKSNFSFYYYNSDDEILREVSILSNFSYDSRYVRRHKNREDLYLIKDEWVKYNKDFSTLVVSILDYVFERGDQDLFDPEALSDLTKNLKQA